MRRVLLDPRRALPVGAAGGVRHERAFDVVVAAVVQHIPVHGCLEPLLPGHPLLPPQLLEGLRVDRVPVVGVWVMG